MHTNAQILYKQNTEFKVQITDSGFQLIQEKEGISITCDCMEFLPDATPPPAPPQVGQPLIED